LEGDNIKLMECMFLLEKLERPAFSDFLTQVRRGVVTALRTAAENDSPDVCRKFVDAEGIFLKAGEMLDLNVSVGHVSGFICASLVSMD